MSVYLKYRANMALVKSVENEVSELSEEHIQYKIPLYIRRNK